MEAEDQGIYVISYDLTNLKNIVNLIKLNQVLYLGRYEYIKKFASKSLTLGKHKGQK